MAADLNRVTLTSRLTREPELRRTQSGMAILSLGIAFNDRRKNPQTGEWEDVGNFADAVMFGTRSESLAGYLHKGSRIAVEGKLRYSSWERDGAKRSKLEVMVDNLVMLDPKPQNGSNGQSGGNAGGYSYGSGSAPQTPPQQPQGGYGYGQPQQPAPQQGGYQQSQAVEPQTSIYDDDIPF